VRERRRRKASQVDWMAVMKGEDQGAMEEGEKGVVRRRISTASRWEMEGREQNLKSVAMDWGSSRRLDRRVTAVAKESAAC
jgi:hypothetical protein